METSSTVELTQEDRAMLMHIYKKRLQLFFKAFLFLFGAGLFAIIKVGRGYSDMTYGSTIIMNTLLLGCIIGLNAAFIYRMRIWKVKKDAENGIKEIIYYTITQKQHFEHTGQFFIGLNHPDYLFHEIDYNTWKNLNIGDAYALYRAPISKYIFNPQGKFSII